MRKFSRVFFPLFLLTCLFAGTLCACAPAAGSGANASSSEPPSSFGNDRSPAGAGSPSSLENAEPEGAVSLAQGLLDPEDALFPEARALTHHLVHFLFTRNHIEEAQPLQDGDLFRFMLSLLVQNENSLSDFYPDCVSVKEDGVAVFPLASVQRMISDVFGQSGWFFADSSYDEGQNAYLVPTGFGLGSVYSCEELRLIWNAEDHTVTAVFSLIDTPDFPGEQHYGTYQITYEAVSEDGRTFLRYKGVQKIGD